MTDPKLTPREPSEAERLAQALTDWKSREVRDLDRLDAAAELRRLAALSESNAIDALNYESRIERLQAENDALRAMHDAAPTLEAQPVAWMHETPGRVDVIHDEVKKLLSAVATDYLYRPIDKSEKYTIPLYAAAQPVEVQSLTDATQFEKDVARWMEKDGLTREQAECEVNYRTTRKALKSGFSAHGIKPTAAKGVHDE